MNNRVFSVLVYCAILVYGQEEEVPPITEVPITEVVTEAVPTICATCECGSGVVDCRSRNIIEMFASEEWEELTKQNIKEVDLSGNSIEILKRLPVLPIEKLNVSSNRLDLIDDWCFKNLENLTTMDLSSNMLTDLNKKVFWGPATFDRITPFEKMRHLNLANNDFHFITKDAFSFMQGLTFLDLSRNPLRSIDQVAMGTLSELNVLRELRLSTCSLETLPSGFFRTFRRLDRLDLSNNKFATIPTALSEPVNLGYLNLNKNPFTEFTEKTALSSLIKLKELQLCNTKLQTIGPGALGGLESLEILYLSNNKRLTVVDEDFLTWVDDDDETKMWPPIKELYMTSNNLSVIDPDVLSRWDVVRAVNFDHNPYVCDCNAQWMVDVLVPLIEGLNGTAGNLICSKPQDLRSLTFAQLHSSSRTLTCTSQDMVMQTPDIAIILGVMIGIFVTFPLVLIIVLLWKKGYFARCRKRFNSEPGSDEENDAF